MTAPLRISWSSLRAHSECKQKGFLFRSGKKSPATDIRGYFHGTVADRVMRNWLSAPEQVPGKMTAMVDELIESSLTEAKEAGDGIVRWKSTTDKSDMREFVVELVTRLEPILQKLVLPYDYEPAKRFEVPVQIPHLSGELTCVHLVGEMDLLTRDDQGRWGIYDLKATKDDNYWRKTFAQLLFYDIAQMAMFNEYATSLALIQPMCKEQVVYFTFTEDHRQEMWSRIVRFASDIWQKDFEPKKSNSGCSYCPVKFACSKFTPISGNKGRISFEGAAGVGD